MINYLRFTEIHNPVDEEYFQKYKLLKTNPNDGILKP